MKLFLGGLLLLAACGSVDDNTHPPDAPRQDSSTSDDAAIDAAPPPPRCDPSKPFGTPVRIDELDITGIGADELQATLSPDELTIWFSSARAGGQGGYDIYTATRGTRTATWGSPTLVAGVNTAATESHPSLSGDQLTLFITYQANPNSSYQILRSTRTSTALPFGAPSLVTVLNMVGANNYEPYVLPDQSAIYFASNRNANGDDDIYVSQGDTHGSFATPAAAVGTSLTSASAEQTPVITPDQLTLYFRTNRSGQYDVWVATRTSVANGFSAPVSLTAVNTSAIELPSWISADNCVLYFTRVVGGATAPPDYDLWFVSKPL